MSSALRVIQKFGGQSALARLIEKRSSTVQHWASSGIIHAKWQGQLQKPGRESPVFQARDETARRRSDPGLNPFYRVFLSFGAESFLVIRERARFDTELCVVAEQTRRAHTSGV
jgi:hypothetical protein